MVNMIGNNGDKNLFKNKLVLLPKLAVNLLLSTEN